MLNLLTISLVLLMVSLGHGAETNGEQSSTPGLELGVIVESLQPGRPVTAHIEHAKLTTNAWFIGEGPKFTKEMALQWQTNYEIFSKALILEARKAHLDAESLTQVLPAIRSAPENGRVAVIPFAAHSTVMKGELVWVVALRWEYVALVKQSQSLGHMRYFIFSQKTLRQVDFDTCG